ncbi:MAG: hypothetical protein KFW21_04515 [Spirochaetota bacterium]|nr:hypothetical protein [Spirochaetota bacterium]
MKKNILLLSFLIFSGCYLNKFSDYMAPTPPVLTLDSAIWTSLVSIPIQINKTVPYTIFVNTDNLIYTYKNQRNQLSLLIHNSKNNITKQHNITSIPLSISDTIQISYTEANNTGTKIIGVTEFDPTSTFYQFKSYILNNNWSTSDLNTYSTDKLITSNPIIFNYENSSSGTLILPHPMSATQKRLSNYNINPTGVIPHRNIIIDENNTYKIIDINNKIIALFFNSSLFKTFNFTDNVNSDGTIIYSSNPRTIKYSLSEGFDVWATHNPDGQNMSIVKITLNNSGQIINEVTVKEKIQGSEGIITKGENANSYFLALKTTQNTLQVLKTSDNFKTLEILGVTSIGSYNLININLTSINGIPFLSYVDTLTDELTILKYSQKENNSDNHTLPEAKITLTSTTVTANTFFNISGSTSLGNNLSYFWSVNPKLGSIIENSLNINTRISLPSSVTPIDIILEINDGEKSYKTIQKITVL